MFDLAVAYDFGDGAEQNYSLAAKYYTLAAEQGHVGAQYNIGNMYRIGQGVEKDIPKAKMWLGKASASRHAIAMELLADLNSSSDKTRIDGASPQNTTIDTKSKQGVVRGRSTNIQKNRSSTKNDSSQIFQYESFSEIHDILKSRYPTLLIIIENGVYFEVLKEDAFRLSDMYGWEVYERQIGVPLTGFPINTRSVWKDFERYRIPYLLVSQLPNQGDEKIERYVSEIHRFNNT